MKERKNVFGTKTKVIHFKNIVHKEQQEKLLIGKKGQVAIFVSECSMCSEYPTLVFRNKWSNNRNSAYYRRDKLKTQILKPTASCLI